MFGYTSSPFLYNEAARMFIMIVQRDVKMDSMLSVQQMDDNPVADEKGSEVLRRYYRSYREISVEFNSNVISKTSKLSPY